MIILKNYGLTKMMLFKIFYYMNNRFNQDEFIQKINHIFKDQDCGHVMRVKGFLSKRRTLV